VPGIGPAGAPGEREGALPLPIAALHAARTTASGTRDRLRAAASDPGAGAAGCVFAALGFADPTGGMSKGDNSFRGWFVGLVPLGHYLPLAIYARVRAAQVPAHPDE
jgi:hypothetical protein